MYVSGTSSTTERPRDDRNSEIGLVTGLLVNLAPPSETPCLIGDDDGVVCRNVAGDAGDCGRRNGEDRWETDPYPSGDGLYPGVACIWVSRAQTLSLSIHHTIVALQSLPKASTSEATGISLFSSKLFSTGCEMPLLPRKQQGVPEGSAAVCPKAYRN